MQEKNKQYFLERERQLGEQQKEYDRKYNAFSAIRAVVFLAGAVSAFIGFADKKSAAVAAFVILMIIFAALVIAHARLAKKIETIACRMEVVQRYNQRTTEEWKNFEVNGSDYIKKTDTIPGDIDTLGNNSLYQLLCLAHTKEGKKKLADSLGLRLKYEKKEIEQRQAAIEELAGDNEFAIEFEAAGLRIEKSKKKFDEEGFREFCENENQLKLPGWTRVVSIILPAVEILLIILAIIGLVKFVLPIVGFVSVLAFSWLTMVITNPVIIPFSGAGTAVQEYRDMLELIAVKDYDSQLLRGNSEVLMGENGALKGFSKLSALGQACNIMYNPLVHQLLNGLFLWDYQVAFTAKKWKEKYGKTAANGFEIIALTEELLSLSVLRRLRKTTFPSVNYECGEKVRLETENVYHPLLKEDSVVSNTVKLRSGITIVTGSNMSGKTTFLRTLAINLVLAYVGAPVCADSFTADYMKIFTSMRVTDDAANGISTFYAEILRIKEMAEYRDKNEPMICFVDEIFKGTNSADRIVGAKEAITRLAGDNCITMVSTHDFELCTIKDKEGTEAYNCHFEEYYNNDELKFDYKLKDGRCTTTNARQLLKMAGFDVR